MTLKTREMATENSVLPSQENNINYIKKYIKISYFNM